MTQNYLTIEKNNGDFVVTGFNPMEAPDDIVIPNGVTKINTGAFSGIASYDYYLIKKIKEKGGVLPGFESIHNPELLHRFKSIQIPEGVKEIADFAFVGFSGLTTLEIPNGVKKIGDFAFLGCSGLTSISLPDSITKIGIDVFRGCSSLVSVKIPNSLTEIKMGTFAECANLSDIMIPNSIVEIGNYAFEGCSNLTSVKLPDRLKIIGIAAFRKCQHFDLISLSANTQLSNESFEFCTVNTIDCYDGFINDFRNLPGEIKVLKVNVCRNDVDYDDIFNLIQSKKSIYGSSCSIRFRVPECCNDKSEIPGCIRVTKAYIQNFLPDSKDELIDVNIDDICGLDSYNFNDRYNEVCGCKIKIRIKDSADFYCINVYEPKDLVEQKINDIGMVVKS